MTTSVGFLLLPNYSSMAYVSAVETLLVCNQICGEERYIIENVCLEGGRTLSSLGNNITTQYSLNDFSTKTHPDIWVLAGAAPVSRENHPKLQEWLCDIPNNQAIGALTSATYDLAMSGQLDGYRAVVHWWNYQNVVKQFPMVRLSNDAYCIDKHRFTCRGGSASLDMMLFLLAQQQGVEVAQAVSSHFADERLGNPESQSPDQLIEQTRVEHPGVSEAIELMASNIEEPLTTDDIAGHINISRRQLERLFKKYLNAVPSRYYLQIRLEQARELIMNTQTSIAEIGLSCGFSSGAHFSTAYRTHFGLTPSEERRLRYRLESGEQAR